MTLILAVQVVAVPTCIRFDRLPHTHSTVISNFSQHNYTKKNVYSTKHMHVHNVMSATPKRLYTSAAGHGLNALNVHTCSSFSSSVYVRLFITVDDYELAGWH